MPLTRSSDVSSLMHVSGSQSLQPKNSSLLRGASGDLRSIRPEAARSNLLRGASADLSEFIWPKDQRPEVPHNDFERAQELPIIDFSGLQSGDVTHKAKIATELTKIFSEWGFVEVVNHGVSLPLIENMQSQANRFFELPLEEKQKAVVTSSDKEIPFGFVLHSGFNYAGRPWVDRFQCKWAPGGCRIREAAEQVFEKADAEGFSKTMDDYNASVEKLGLQILELCAQGLGLEPSTFTKPFLEEEGDCIARVNYYPPCPQPSLTLGLGAHTDPNLLTILNQCKVGGLQVCRKGTWITVKPRPGSFIVNIGDSFEAWSNGHFSSVQHRAVVNDNKSRISVVFFMNPPPNSVMSIPPKLEDAKHPLQFRSAFTWLEYRTRMLQMHKEGKGNLASKTWLRLRSI